MSNLTIWKMWIKTLKERKCVFVCLLVAFCVVMLKQIWWQSWSVRPGMVKWRKGWQRWWSWWQWWREWTRWWRRPVDREELISETRHGGEKANERSDQHTGGAPPHSNLISMLMLTTMVLMLKFLTLWLWRHNLTYHTHTHTYARTHTHGNKLKRQDKKLQSVAAIILWQLQIVEWVLHLGLPIVQWVDCLHTGGWGGDHKLQRASARVPCLERNCCCNAECAVCSVQVCKCAMQSV